MGLQKDYTTPEQSKRLLELGVPVDSADCYYDSWRQIQWRQLKDLDHDFFQKYNHYTPCWTVGRLITISRVCSTLHENVYSFSFYKDTEDNVEWAIRFIESGVKTGNMDFSKWEEYDKNRS